MALETRATPTPQVATTVEPSRAWILGLVVETDGSVSGPGWELGWPEHEGAGLIPEDLPESAAG